MKLKFHPFTLELKHTFTTNHGSRNTQQSLVVELEDGRHSGYGEAAATSYYGVSVERMIDALERICPLIEAGSRQEPEAFWDHCAPNLRDEPFALCALDMAMHDLDGKKQGLPLYKHWGLGIESNPLTNYTIGIDSVENMVQKMLDFPWPLYKIKLGAKGGIEEDLAIVRELRKHTRSSFRVDANGAWTADETIKASAILKELAVEFIEQPLPAALQEEMKVVYRHSALPLIADESCIEEADVAGCHRHFHGINIKLTKCGGLTPARRMINHARALGMQVMVGCMTESSVGISAIAQLLPLLDYADMDGALLLKKDIAEGVTIKNGRVYYPDRNGTGVILLNTRRQ